jgi:uncharacterized membrane protein YphA (DoxX/SURF4 family)
VSAAFSGWFFSARLERWLSEPQAALRIEILRIGAPLAILGFMSSRVAHADEWLGDAGFRVPDLGVADYRQPLFIPPLPSWAAWSVAIALVASGLAIALGLRPRRAAVVFAITTAFVALSDRLAAFSVTKMAPMVALTIALSPCGRRLSIDAWLRARRGETLERLGSLPSGSLRFVQVLLPVIYSASGIAKIRGDWLTHSHVLWTHLHDSYQTAFTVALANLLPSGAWTLLQGMTLAFEALAPLWFGFARTRTAGLVVGVGMHTMIGLMFGPVRYFAMLMSTLLITAYLPDRWLDRAATRLGV